MNAANISKSLNVFLLTILLIESGFNLQVFGGTSTKTFDFGVGGDNPTFHSHSRTFAPPEAVAVAVRVNYRTAGDLSIPLIIEIEDAKDRILSANEVLAEKTPKQLVINIAATANTVNGCEKAWQVRVRSKDGKVPAAKVFGDITFSFIDPPAVNLAVEGKTFALRKGEQVNRQIGDTKTLKHPGILNIKSSWTHNPLARALPLKFELVRPDGSTAKSITGYGTNSNANPKINLTYRITAFDTKQSGIWRLRIINETEQEIQEINPVASFTNQCFE